MLKAFVLLCRLLLALKANGMKSRYFALRLAATVVLIAPAAAQAQGTSQSVCRQVWDWGTAKYVQVCNSVYYPPPPQPAPSAPEPEPGPAVKRSAPSEETVRYDTAAEARKAQLQSGERRVPASSSLCSPPYRMSARDGCQR